MTAASEATARPNQDAMYTDYDTLKTMLRVAHSPSTFGWRRAAFADGLLADVAGVCGYSTLVRGDGETSSMTWPISSDAMPSIMAWWVLVMTAVWFFARPSTR